MVNQERTPERLLVSVNSRKGGVGKTTLALAMALSGIEEALSAEDDNPDSDAVPKAVFVDADIFGSEITDALLPERPNPETDAMEWDLGVGDILTQSTGGNITMAELIHWRLKGIRESRKRLSASAAPPPEKTRTLPVISFPVTERQEGRLLLVPSSRWRDPADRIKNQPGHDSPFFLFLAETMGRAQVELRLTALITAIMKVFDPKIVVVDNAPFHLPISNVWKKWIDPDKRRALMVDGESESTCWRKYKVCSVEVAGPERQDLLPFLADLVDDAKRKARHDQGLRWVLNKDIHSEGVGAAVCNTRYLLGDGLPLVEELGHVVLAPELFLGAHGENISRTSLTATGFEFDVQPREYNNYPTLLWRAYRAGALSPSVWSGQGYVKKSWWDFLMGETAGTRSRG